MTANLMRDLTHAHSEIARLRAGYEAADQALGFAMDTLGDVCDALSAPKAQAAREALDRAEDALCELKFMREHALAMRSGAAGSATPLDLNALVSAFANGDQSHNIAAITSDAPIFLAAQPARVQALVREILRHWGAVRASGDCLDFLVCDAGHSARLSAVFRWQSKRGDGLAFQGFTARLESELAGLARTCQGAVVSTSSSDDDSLLGVVSIDFAKLITAPLFTRDPREIGWEGLPDHRVQAIIENRA